MNRKGCPLLVQSETNPSMTITGQSWTRTWFAECIGEKCAAYQGGLCDKFQTDVTFLAEVQKDGQRDL
nr:MAG TPA: hypothetical protein [Caudoviricetes sp.]